MSFRTIAKLALILVIIGFFMPVACDRTGFQIADFFMKNDNVFNGLLTYLLFGSAVVGVIIGVLMLTGKGGVSPTIDWAVIIVCIASGLIIYFSVISKNNIKLNNGGYFILAGWIVSVGCQVFSFLKRE